MARPWHQHRHHLIPVSFFATTAARRSVRRTAAKCLQRPPGKATSRPARRRNLDQGPVLGRSGALCMYRTTTHNDAERYTQAARRPQPSSRQTEAVMVPKRASMTPKISRSLIVTTSTRGSHFRSLKYNMGLPVINTRLPYYINAGSPEKRFTRSLRTKSLGLPQRQLSESLEHCSMRLLGFPRPH